MADKSILEVAKSQLIAFNDKNWDAVKEVLATDTVYDEVATQRRIQGVEEVLSAWKGWAKAFPDAKGNIDKETVGGNNTVVIELTWHAMQTGLLQLPGKDLAATGKKVELRACQIIEVSDGKVKTLRHYFDLSSLLQQLSV
ncbi:MAG TPA: ester cyclase [Pyrinomonadaceae bacterium]|nr:ester cyclase [Pyrinomonadaceae bacterium]